MTPYQPLEVVRRFYGDVWNRGDATVAREICDPSMAFRGSLGSVRRGVEEFLDYVAHVRGALADYECVILDAVTEAQRVFAKMLFRGRHVGAFQGVAPTGARLEWHGAALFRIEHGRIRDLWVLGDLAGLHEQLRRASEGSERP